MSTAKMIFTPSRQRRAAAEASAALAPRRAACAAAMTGWPVPAQTVAASTTSIRARSIPRSASWSRACSAARTVPEIAPDRWIETMSSPRSRSGS